MQEEKRGSLSKAMEGLLVREVRQPGRERKRYGRKCRARKAKKPGVKPGKKSGKKTGKKPGKKSGKKPGKKQRQGRKKKCGKKCRARKAKSPSKTPGRMSKNKPGRQASSCLADVLTKTKKFNKVQTELRMLNRIVG